MSSTVPFTGSPSRTDWLLVNMMAFEQVYGRLDEAAELCLSIQPQQNWNIAPSLFAPSAIVVNLGTFALVSITGTTTVWQWMFNALGSAQSHISPIAGDVDVYFGLAGLGLYGQIAGLLDGHAPGLPVVFVGHSLGGALAQICTSLALGDARTVQGCYVSGCPRVGNPTFAASIDAATWRLEDTDDPIVSVPPVLWAGVGSRFPLPGPGIPAVYAHGGTAFTMDQYGRFTDGSSPIGLIAVAQQAARLAAPTHLSSEYVRRIRARWSGEEYQAPGAQGYAHPSVLGAFWVTMIAPAQQMAAAELCLTTCA